MNKKELIISCDDSVEVSRILSEFKTKTLADDRLSITYDPEKVAVDKILLVLANNKVQIKDISTSQPDLEEIFKHLVSSKI